MFVVAKLFVEESGDIDLSACLSSTENAKSV